MKSKKLYSFGYHSKDFKHEIVKQKIHKFLVEKTFLSESKEINNLSLGEMEDR